MKMLTLMTQQEKFVWHAPWSVGSKTSSLLYYDEIIVFENKKTKKLPPLDTTDSHCRGLQVTSDIIQQVHES